MSLRNKWIFFFCFFIPSLLAAQEAEAPKLNQADTVWMIVSSALVFFMIPGLALFYGGIVRSKNVLSTMMHSFIAMIVMTLQWTVFGYSLAFSGSSPYIGDFSYFLLNGIDETTLELTIPKYVHFLFQGMFALITPALISGAIAERVKVSGYVLFIFLWATLVYDPVAHWVWAENGWLLKMGALDFAGGTVVHLISGIAGLACALVIGKRKGEEGTTLTNPNNMTYTLLGSGLLWFGWFGFNAGSGLAINGLAARAFVVTLIAPAAAGASWLILEYLHTKKATALGAASGIVAGLVVITPASGFVGPGAAIIMGLLVSPICYVAILMKGKLGYDDTLDAFGVHGVGGAVGALLTGVFAISLAENMTRGGQIYVQVVSIVATGLYSFVVSFALAFAIEKTIGFRVNEKSEISGLDEELHGEKGYNI